MINEAYVSFEVAKLLKEKGYNNLTCTCYLILDEGGYTEIELCDGCHQDERYDSEDSSWKYGTLLLRPTHQMAMAWLREERGIFIMIGVNCNNNEFHTSVYQKDEEGYDGTDFYCQCFMDYEEAVEAALKYTLENLI